VAIQEEWGRPTGLLQSLWGTAVRILLASADSSILIRCPNSLLFCMIEVRRGCLVRRRTSQLEMRWCLHSIKQSINQSGIFKVAEVIQTTARSTREKFGEVQSRE